MSIKSEINQHSNGAQFRRADLHIHSFDGSHDVKDLAITPEAIVKTAIAEKLRLIAIAHHNESRNVEATLKAAAGSPVLVIPAVELLRSRNSPTVIG